MCIKLTRCYTKCLKQAGDDKPELYDANSVVNIADEQGKETNVFKDFRHSKREGVFLTHRVQNWVRCAHPEGGLCLMAPYDRQVEWYQSACHHCMGIPDRYPVSEPYRKELAKALPPQTAKEQSEWNTLADRYFERIAILLRHMILEYVPAQHRGPSFEYDLLVSIYTERYCFRKESHIGEGWRDCNCFSENHMYCWNIGRALRSQRVTQCMDYTEDRLLEIIRAPEDDPGEYSTRYRATLEIFRATNRMVPWQIDFHQPYSDQGVCYRECVLFLDTEVAKLVKLGANKVVATDQFSYPDNDWEEMVRYRSVAIHPAIAWIAYDSGLSSAMRELLLRRLTVFLNPLATSTEISRRGGRLVKPEIELVIRDTIEKLHRWRGYPGSATWPYIQRAVRDEKAEVLSCLKQRSLMLADARSRLELFHTAAMDVAVLREVPLSKGITECAVCYDEFVDDAKAMSGPSKCCLRICESHYFCYSCVRSMVLRDVPLLASNAAGRCPLCKAKLLLKVAYVFDRDSGIVEKREDGELSDEE